MVSKLVRSLFVCSAALSQTCDEDAAEPTSLLQQHRGKEAVGVDCKSGRCTSMTTTTTMALSADPEAEEECEGENCIIDKICCCSPPFSYEGGLDGWSPPKSGRRRRRRKTGLDDEAVQHDISLSEDPNGQLKYLNVADVNGQMVDMVVKELGDAYYNSHRGLEWMTASNGENDLPCGLYHGAGSLGMQVFGTYTFVFEFFAHGTDEAVMLPYFPITFYDVDGYGGAETIQSCDAKSSLVHKSDYPKLLKNHDDECISYTGDGNADTDDIDWDDLNLDQKEAAVTFLYKDTSRAEITITVGGSDPTRLFLFKSSTRALACIDNDD